MFVLAMTSGECWSLCDAGAVVIILTLCTWCTGIARVSLECVSVARHAGEAWLPFADAVFLSCAQTGGGIVFGLSVCPSGWTVLCAQLLLELLFAFHARFSVVNIYTCNDV